MYQAVSMAAVQAIAASGPIKAVAAPKAKPAADHKGCSKVGRTPRSTSKRAISSAPAPRGITSWTSEEAGPGAL
jgi:hypothetical protein